MNRETARQEIRTRILCTELLEPSKGGMYCCPICGSGHGKNGTGAVKFYPETNTYYCHACGQGGDTIDLFRAQTGKDYNTALSLMADRLGITIDEYKPAAAADFAQPQKNGLTERATGDETTPGKDKTPAETKARQNALKTPTEATTDYTEYYRACATRINEPAAAEYLKKRGISTETAQAYWIGYDPAADPARSNHPCPRLIIPTSTAHYIGRRIDGIKEFAKLNAKGSTPAIFNSRALYAQDAQELFVTEGAFDALSIIEAGEPAIALNSANNADALLDLLKDRKTDAALILCPDNDPDEKTRAKIQKAFDGLAKGLQALGICFITADINGLYKDANEHLTGDKDAFIDAVKAARRQALTVKERQRQEAQRAEQERQQRTGAGMVDAFLEAIQTHKYEPVPTGITDIDKAIGGGFLREQVILLGAAPGVGKTALAQWIFEGMARRGQTCLYLNLEMSREQMLARSVSRIAAENGHKIKPTEILQGYKWNGEQEYIVTKAAERYKAEIAPRMIYNPEGVSAELDSILAYIEAEAGRAEAAQMPAPCVVLDYLQIIRGREREEDAAIIKRAMAELKKFAMRHKTFVFMIMANNRSSNRTGDVTQESGRDTSALEYGADLQLGLAYTLCLKKYGDRNKDELTQEEKRYITLKITKGRWSDNDAAVNLYFDGESMNYKQLAPGAIAEVEQKKAGRKL